MYLVYNALEPPTTLSYLVGAVRISNVGDSRTDFALKVIMIAGVVVPIGWFVLKNKHSV